MTREMKVHHLDCGTMCPRVPDSWIGGPEMCCHCLLVETPSSGLVLVDTGIGTDDLEVPGRLGRPFRFFMNLKYRREETALERVRALGHDPKDVRHLIVTHLDLDHAGGMSDFPDATVHVFAPEHDAFTRRASLHEKNRYRPLQAAHGPKWQRYELQGETWLDFECVRGLEGLPPEILMVPLTGHTRGHCGIAVRGAGGRWLVHAGDAFFHRAEMHATNPKCPGGLAAFQQVIAMDDKMRRHNQQRLRELAEDHAHEVSVFCAHDPVQLQRLASGADVRTAEAAAAVA